MTLSEINSNIHSCRESKKEINNPGSLDEILLYIYIVPFEKMPFLETLTKENWGNIEEQNLKQLKIFKLRGKDSETLTFKMNYYENKIQTPYFYFHLFSPSLFFGSVFYRTITYRDY